MKFKVGQEVKVYRSMNPRTDLKGVYKIKCIGPTHSGGTDLLWLEGISGAWHPDACEAVGSDCMTTGELKSNRGEKKMKTLMMFETFEGEVQLFAFEKDLSHLNDVHIGEDKNNDKLQLELERLLWSADGEPKFTPILEPTKDWDVFIRCGQL